MLKTPDALTKTEEFGIRLGGMFKSHIEIGVYHITSWIVNLTFLLGVSNVLIRRLIMTEMPVETK